MELLDAGSGAPLEARGGTETHTQTERKGVREAGMERTFSPEEGGMGCVKRTADDANLAQPESKKHADTGEAGAALRAASAQGLDEDVARLIKAGAPVNSEDAEGRTALSYAVEGGKSATVAVLIRLQRLREIPAVAQRRELQDPRVEVHEHVVRNVQVC